MRKLRSLSISVQQLLSNKRVQSFQYVRDEEVAFLINKICRSCFNNGGSFIDLTEMINNTVSRCVLGRRTEEENGRSKFGELARRLMVQFTSFCFGDMFPCLGCLDVLTGHIGRLNATFRALDAFLIK
ncbi:hypothetical protein Dsin_005589 [Dipteronia sinensis]|uniref:Uncharacterized protein n=1 Tax=Dipteronia sinensis TaxID=43782 RepID=A0AAE0EFC7_9ROSI|nr:hypothetical protein Dsin_005589 [Dipteronia sinensis]